LALAIALGDLSSVYVAGWTDARLVEAALLFDLAIVLPCLYAWCYRHKGRVAVVQAVALACFAIWCTGKIVPPEHQYLMETVGWLRYVGLAGLVALEIKLGVAIYRAVIFKDTSKQEARASFEAEGMPPWLAKFMAFEAGLWRRAYLFLRRLLRRDR
jgi:hypothetical protein